MKSSHIHFLAIKLKKHNLYLFKHLTYTYFKGTKKLASNDDEFCFFLNQLLGATLLIYII
jgi:hypothetical protein